AGVTVQVSRDDLVPQITKVLVQLLVTPANAAVTYSGADGRTHAMNGPSLELDEGEYTFTATALGYNDASQTLIVGTGKRNDVALNLTAMPTPPPRLTKGPTKMDQWTARSGWGSESGWLVHQGGGLVLYPAAPSSGTFVFSARRAAGSSGKGRIQWVVGCIDDKNKYILFGIDKKNLHYALVVDGRKQKEQFDALRTEAKELQYTLRIEIRSDNVATYVQDSQGWQQVNTLPAPGFSLANGKFGFYLPAKDEIYISNFTFTPD